MGKDNDWPRGQGDPVSKVPADPEAPIPLKMPKDLGADPSSKVALDWLLAAIRAHALLRAKSFYDTGHFISELLDRRAMFGAVDIKDLCSNVPLGMSHRTAHKYLQISRSFPRSVALEQGIEKCYALVVYARTVDRAGEAGRSPPRTPRPRSCSGPAVPTRSPTSTPTTPRRRPRLPSRPRAPLVAGHRLARWCAGAPNYVRALTFLAGPRRPAGRPPHSRHLHLIALDGVFVETDDESLLFHRLPSLSNSDVADLLHTARVRILGFLERRGVVERDRELGG